MSIPREAWVVVAHPDDELIFAGGLLLESPATIWHVVVVTHAYGSPRAQESTSAERALRGLGVRVSYQFLGHRDVHRNTAGGIDVDGLRRELGQLSVGTAHGVYTHGPSGEYGHPAHVTVSAVARQTWPGGTYPRWCFHVENPYPTLETSAAADALHVRSHHALAVKRWLFRSCYPSQQVVWQSLPSLMHQTMHTAESHVRTPRA